MALERATNTTQPLVKRHGFKADIKKVRRLCRLRLPTSAPAGPSVELRSRCRRRWF
jgi:hypothetical protein